MSPVDIEAIRRIVSRVKYRRSIGYGWRESLRAVRSMYPKPKGAR